MSGPHVANAGNSPTVESPAAVATVPWLLDEHYVGLTPAITAHFRKVLEARKEARHVRRSSLSGLGLSLVALRSPVASRTRLFARVVQHLQSRAPDPPWERTLKPNLEFIQRLQVLPHARSVPPAPTNLALSHNLQSISALRTIAPAHSYCTMALSA